VITKLLGTSLYLISTNFHTELKLQVNVSHDLNSATFTLYATTGVGKGSGAEGVIDPSLGFEI